VDAFEQMVNLTRLDISDTGRHLIFLLVDVLLPRLVEVKIPYTAELVDFLRACGRNLKTVIVQTGIPGSGLGNMNNSDNGPGSAVVAGGGGIDPSLGLSKTSSTLECQS
jgi:hypothetical protein